MSAPKMADISAGCHAFLYISIPVTKIRDCSRVVLRIKYSTDPGRKVFPVSDFVVPAWKVPAVLWRQMRP